MEGWNDLVVFNKAFESAMLIFELSKSFPKIETYSLTDQIRRSSRSVCATISEGYRKRKYQNYFITKMIDADGECSETLTWLKFAKECKYLDEENYQVLRKEYQEIGKILGSIILNPEKFILKK